MPIKQKIKKDDNVIITAGRDKGRQGKILKVDPKNNQVFIEDINQVVKHIKPNPKTNQTGGIIKKAMPIDISNVAIVNATTNKPDRIKMKITSEGKKQRHFKSNDEIIDI